MDVSLNLGASFDKRILKGITALRKALVQWNVLQTRSCAQTGLTAEGVGDLTNAYSDTRTKMVIIVTCSVLLLVQNHKYGVQVLLWKMVAKIMINVLISKVLAFASKTVNHAHPFVRLFALMAKY